LLVPRWHPRVLLRAQLIESGFTVCATESWTSARQQLLTVGLPHLVVVDLESLAEPHAVLAELHDVVQPARVVVVGAAATILPAEARRLGFVVLERPIAIKTVVATVARALGRTLSP
jgi:DNA-binding NtrC family response regulator